MCVYSYISQRGVLLSRWWCSSSLFGGICDLFGGNLVTLKAEIGWFATFGHLPLSFATFISSSTRAISKSKKNLEMRTKTAKEIHGEKRTSQPRVGQDERSHLQSVQEATFTGASSELPLDLDRKWTKLGVYPGSRLMAGSPVYSHHPWKERNMIFLPDL